MRVACLSDIHGYLPEVPDADLLLLAGDYPRDHRITGWYRNEFRQWLEKLSARMKVVGVAGNHDFLFERDRDFARQLPWVYLQDSYCGFQGLKIYGSPWQPRFYDWAFNLDEEDLTKKWALIPDDTDVLVLHGPPHGFGDISHHRDPGDDDTEWPGYKHVGSPSLTRRILQVQPKLAVAGHIHSGHGRYEIGRTLFVNASYVGEDYKPAYPVELVNLECCPEET